MVGGIKVKNLFIMFLSFFKIGAFTFGGGYAMIPLIEREVVDTKEWISKEEFTDILVIAQSFPGAIAVNTSLFIGYRINGFWGSVFATIGVVTFSFILVSIATHYMIKFKNSKILKNALIGMRPALIGLIISAFISLAGESYTDIKSVIIGGIILLISLKSKIHPILIIVLSGVLGVVFYGVL